MQVSVSGYYYMYKNYMVVTGVGTVTDNYRGVSNGHFDYIDVDGDGEFTIGTDTLFQARCSFSNGMDSSSESCSPRCTARLTADWLRPIFRPTSVPFIPSSLTAQ